eukprot:gene16316-biopygen11996
MEAQFNNIESRLTAMQAAIDGQPSAPTGLFQLRQFQGLPNEDVNDWLSRFEALSRFNNWTERKRFSALTLSLEGAAKAWYDSQTEESVANFEDLSTALKTRFGPPTLEFLFRQELYSRKQGQNEPLSAYTEDISRKGQRISLSDKEKMNIFISGLSQELKNHVVLNQPETFAEAENLARLMEAVSQSKKSPPTAIQEQRIKELESQVNLLVSLAAQKKSVSQPVQALSASNLHAQISQISDPALQPQISGKPDALQNYLVAQQHDQSDFGEAIAANVIAAINANFANPQQQGFRNAGKPWQPRGNYGGPRGHNLRTTDGQPICNKCRRVGHVARNCQESSAQYNNFGPPPPVNPASQSRPFGSQSQFRPQPQFRQRLPFQPQQEFQPGPQIQNYSEPHDLNETGSSARWGH